MWPFRKRRGKEEEAAAELEQVAHNLKELEEAEDQLISWLSQYINKIARRSPQLGFIQKRLLVLAKYIPFYGNRDAPVHSKLKLVTRFMEVLPHSGMDQRDIERVRKIASDLIINYGKQYQLIHQVQKLSKKQVAA